MPGESEPLKIEKKARWLIPNEFRREAPPIIRRAAIDLITNIRPNALLHSISATYNCVGMVVANRRAWVDPMHLHKVLEDDGFRKLADSAEAQIGDVVIYQDEDGDPTHVGILIAKKIVTDPQNPGDSLMILSKWGDGGEYIHELTYVPILYGNPSEFWTDRKEA